MRSALVVGIALLSLVATPVLAAPQISFGDDSSEYSHDEECDDPRFDGPGMTGTALLGADVMADATDCGSAYAAGRLTFMGVAEDGTVDFGDDSGDYAKDGECDDLRFKGSGMTNTGLIAADIMHDASDCRAAFKAGKIKVHYN